MEFGQPDVKGLLNASKVGRGPADRLLGLSMYNERLVRYEYHLY